MTAGVKAVGLSLAATGTTASPGREERWTEEGTEEEVEEAVCLLVGEGGAEREAAAAAVAAAAAGTCEKASKTSWPSRQTGQKSIKRAGRADPLRILISETSSFFCFFTSELLVTSSPVLFFSCFVLVFNNFITTKLSKSRMHRSPKIKKWGIVSDYYTDFESVEL